MLATITVNTLVDENNGIGTGGVSLREAVAAANTGDTINFSVTGTINLLGGSGFGQIAIGKSMTIQGPGASLLTIRAFDPDPGGTNNSNGQRIFLVEDNFFTLNVTISGLTLTNGDPTVATENDGGGAILNRENLTLSACVISGNFAPNGGAIYSTNNNLVLNDCTILSNAASDGAILVSGGSVSMTRSTVAGSTSTNSGGGILARGVPVNVVDSTISGNFTDEYGGGLYLYQGSLTMSGSTVSGNGADNNHDGTGSGGGIYNLGGALSIVNSTISGNSAGEGGGGIFSSTAQNATISHSTITGNAVANTATSYGGGINSPATANLNNTIVAGNLRGAATRDDVKGTFTSSYSLIGDKRDATVNNTAGSQIGTTATPIDAKLAGLANNGGLTLTHALLSGSPALDAGNPAAMAGQSGVPLYDQRGASFPRVVDFDGAGGARIDIGAVEMAARGPALPGDYNLNHVVDAGDYVLWRKTLNTSVSPAYAGADGDGNGVINGNDYTVWRSHFGNTGTVGGGVTVNESGESEKAATPPPAASALMTASPPVERAAHVVARESQIAAVDEAIQLLAGVSGAGAVDGTVTDSGDDVINQLSKDDPTGEASVNTDAVRVGPNSSL